MALEEITLTDKIEVTQNGSLQIRHRHSIVDADTGVEKAASFHRHVANPGDDVTGECDRVQAVAAAVWTPECIAAYQALLNSENLAKKPSDLAKESTSSDVQAADAAAIATEPESVVTETPTEA